MSSQPLAAILEFVEGRIHAREFEARLYADPGFETLLGEDLLGPLDGRGNTTLYLYLLQLNYGDPGDVLNAHGQLRRFLERRGTEHCPTQEHEALYDLLLDCQPPWLAVDPAYIQEAILKDAGGRQGDDLREWLEGALLERFRCQADPPEWLQAADWPIGPNGPLVFLGQVDAGPQFHDDAAVYVFLDPVSGEVVTRLQVA